MFGRAHHHCVDVAGFLVEFAEIPVRSRLGIFCRRSTQVLCVDIAERHDVFGFCRVCQIAPATTPAADDGKVQFRVGRPGADNGRKPDGGCSQTGGLDEPAPGLPVGGK